MFGAFPNTVVDVFHVVSSLFIENIFLISIALVIYWICDAWTAWTVCTGH